ncbi:MAG: ComF family protein [Brevinema sp.]
MQIFPEYALLTTNIFQSFAHLLLKRPCINCGLSPKQPWYLLCASCLEDIMPINRTNRCLFCLGTLNQQQQCPDCHSISFKWNHFDALWDYHSVASQLYLKYKFEGTLASEKDLVRHLAPSLQWLNQTETTPLLLPCGGETWQRLGFHPMQHLLAQCGINTHVPFIKVKGQAQKNLSADERRARRNFLQLKKDFIPPQNILLLDDIVTTGATCHEGVTLLHQAGAKTINIFALFRN